MFKFEELTKGQALCLLERLADINEKIIDFEKDTDGKIAILGLPLRRLHLDDKIFFDLCELLEISYTVIDRNDERYELEASAEIKLNGIDYIIFCIFNAQEGETKE